MGDDYNINDKIVAIQQGEDFRTCAPLTVAGDQSADTYIDHMHALGWAPVLVVHADGRSSLFERHPDGPGGLAIEEGHKVSAKWMATPECRDAVKRAMQARGLVRRH